jgi:ankyrin repeat protein
MKFKIGLVTTFLLAATFAAAAPPATVVDAARTGDWSTVRSLVAANKAAVNTPDIDGTRPLHWAIRAGEADIVEVLLKAGADANAKDRLDVTPLFLAAMNGDGVIVRKLLNAGANANQVEKTGETILMVAIRTGSTDAVRALLEHKANANYAEPQLQLTPLMLAAEGGYTDIVADLIKSGADIQVRTRTGATPARRLPCVAQSGCGSHGEGIVRGGWPEKGIRAPIPGNLSPLMYAAREGKIDAARLLLDAGANVNEVDKNDFSPLFMAISNNHPDMARFLIEKGANIHAKDWYGRTPLFAAVEMRNADMDYRTFELLQTPEDRKAMFDFIKLLLDKGVDPNIQVTEVPPLRSWMYLLGGSLAWVDFTGQTPFLLASLSGDVSTMRLLLEYKADPKIATYSGTTPLMAAAGVNWVFNQTYTEGEPALLEAVKLCIELGMDVNAKNSMGLTPVMGAANRGSDSIIEYLVSKGARLDLKDNVGRTPYNWAEGVFLATHSPVPKPSSMALIQRLSGK